MAAPLDSEGAVGSSIRRVDGAAKVTGRALYVDDLSMPGMLFGATVRSGIAHGILLGFERDPDFDWRGISVVTAADIPGQNAIRLIEDDQPALVAIGDPIRHVDEALALIAAPNRERAREAAAHFRPRVRELPAVFDVEEALGSAVKIYRGDNLFKEFRFEKGDDLEAAFAAADLVVEGVYRTPAQEQMYIEPQGILSWWDGRRCLPHRRLAAVSLLRS